MLHDLVADGFGRNFIAVRFHEFIDHFVYRPLDPSRLTGRFSQALSIPAISFCDQMFRNARPLQNPEIVALNFLVSGERCSQARHSGADG